MFFLAIKKTFFFVFFFIFGFFSVCKANTYLSSPQIDEFLKFYIENFSNSNFEDLNFEELHSYYDNRISDLTIFRTSNDDEIQSFLIFANSGGLTISATKIESSSFFNKNLFLIENNSVSRKYVSSGGIPADYLKYSDILTSNPNKVVSSGLTSPQAFFYYNFATATAISSVNLRIATLEEEFENTTSSLSEKADTIIDNQEAQLDYLEKTPEDDTVQSGLNSIFSSGEISKNFPEQKNGYEEDLENIVNKFKTALETSKNDVSFTFNGKSYTVDISVLNGMYEGVPQLKALIQLISISFFTWQILKELERITDAYNSFNFVEVTDSVQNVHYTDIF